MHRSMKKNRHRLWRAAKMLFVCAIGLAALWYGLVVLLVYRAD